MKQWHVYIMASPSKTTYVGVTSSLEARVDQHRRMESGFTSRYNITRLVYYEDAPDAMSAIAREKQIKGWTRAKKVALVDSFNAEWDDLAETRFANSSTPTLTAGPATRQDSASSQDPSLRSE
jgi:putative endonuclease